MATVVKLRTGATAEKWSVSMLVTFDVMVQAFASWCSYKLDEDESPLSVNNKAKVESAIRHELMLHGVGQIEYAAENVSDAELDEAEAVVNRYWPHLNDSATQEA